MVSDDETEIHMPPPIPGRARRMSLPEPESPPPRVDVRLVGGPAHGRVLKVREDRKRIEVPYTTEDETPEIPEDGSRPKPVEVAAVMLIYTRKSDKATTAEYTDMELFT